jgi:methionyl-tRNA formyltransferase
LPRYRGAAPINWALINGETETGVAVIKMSARMDAGDVLGTVPSAIGPDEDAGQLEDRLAALGAELVLKTLESIAQGRVAAIPQDESLASCAPKLKAEHSRIRWDAPGAAIRNLIRGTTPRPGAFTLFRGKRLEVGRAGPSSDAVDNGEPGTVAGFVPDEGPAVRTGDESIILHVVKPEGKRAMTGAEFVRGYRPLLGERLG